MRRNGRMRTMRTMMIMMWRRVVRRKNKEEEEHDEERGGRGIRERGRRGRGAAWHVTSEENAFSLLLLSLPRSLTPSLSLPPFLSLPLSLSLRPFRFSPSRPPALLSSRYPLTSLTAFLSSHARNGRCIL
eukprot:86537-Rhodomonas_salina.2